MSFLQICDIMFDMKNSQVNENLKKVVAKRNFYTNKDAGNVYLYALLLPLAVGLLFCYISISIAEGNGMIVPEGENVISYMFANYVWFSVPYMILTQLVFFLIYVAYSKINRIKVSACNVSFKKAKPTIALVSVGAGIVAVWGFIFLIEGAFGAMFSSMGIVSDSLGLPLNTVGWLFVNLLIAGVLPAICEELLFRGIIFQGMKERFSALASVLLNGLLFALMHQSIQQFIYPFILGCVLSVLMHRTNNLLYPILMHMANNFMTIIISFLQLNGYINLPLANMPWWLIIIAILLAVATGALFYVIDRFFLKKQEKVKIEKEGECYQTEPFKIGKMPITMALGGLVALAFLIVNLL